MHPDTGEKVPLPFRVSAFAPSNIILTLGLLTPNPSVRRSVDCYCCRVLVNVDESACGTVRGLFGVCVPIVQHLLWCNVNDAKVQHPAVSPLYLIDRHDDILAVDQPVV